MYDELSHYIIPVFSDLSLAEIKDMHLQLSTMGNESPHVPTLTPQITNVNI